MLQASYDLIKKKLEFINHLVDSWSNFRKGKDLFDSSRSKIANTNGFGESKILAILHSFPYILDVDCSYELFWNCDFELLLV